MKINPALVATLYALASFPLLAQQPPPANQVPPNKQAASTEASTVEMSPVNGQLVSKLDSKAAKAGDSVVIETKQSVKTADGTEIPKGSKLVGRVMGVHPSGAGENSQVVLQFDHLELKGGQSVLVHSQIQAIAPAEGAASTTSSASSATGAPQGPGGNPGAAPAGGAPAAGTVVARNGNIAISTTSIPGVLVANNAPGQQDPRMAQASSILLGAKQDIQLEGGTQMVVGLSATGAGTQ